MAVTTTFYNNFYEQTLIAGIDWDADTFKVALTTSAYVLDIDLHDHFDNITNEVTGTGYTAGGDTVTSIVVTQDNTNDRATLDFDDPEWLASTITARNGILYKDTGVASTSPLVCEIDFGADFSSSATPFRIELDLIGFLTLDQA